MSLTTFLQQCLTGISLGGAYALIAIGYTLVYGILRLINFAHGDIFMMAGYFMIFAMASLPWFIAIPVTLIVTILHKRKFTYDRQSEKMLKNLKEIAEFEGYMDGAKEESAALETKLTHNLDHEISFAVKYTKNTSPLVSLENCSR